MSAPGKVARRIYKVRPISPDKYVSDAGRVRSYATIERAKRAAERMFLGANIADPAEVIVYRASSVNPGEVGRVTPHGWRWNNE